MSTWNCKPNAVYIVCSEPNGPDMMFIPVGDGEGAGVTAGQLQEAIRKVAFPRPTIVVEPGGRTLVNLPTIFSTDGDTVHRTETLLGLEVELEVRPTSWTWHFGDGDSTTTDSPGRPYPHDDVTHRYLHVTRQLHPSVDVAYRVRYRVDDGDWTTLDATIPAAGPAADLQVVEASPVLTRP